MKTEYMNERIELHCFVISGESQNGSWFYHVFPSNAVSYSILSCTFIKQVCYICNYTARLHYLAVCLVLDDPMLPYAAG